MTETFATINQWQRETFPTSTLAGVLGHIAEEWEEFITAPDLENKIKEATDLIILLSCFVDKARDGDGCQGDINETMRVNRERFWNIQSDGTGRHVR